MLISFLEYAVIAGLALIILINWDNILYYIVGVFYYLLELTDVTLYMLILTLIVIALSITIVFYWINKRKIQRLSIVDFMPVDEYELKKKEWTQAALADLVKNPKYRIIKERLEEEQERKKKIGILSPNSNQDDQDSD